MAEVTISMGKHSRGSIRLNNLEKALPGALKRGFRGAGVIFERAIKKRVSTGGSAGLHVRTGSLRRSVNFIVRDTAGGLQLRVGPNVVYAAIHEFGGTIRPTQGKYLRFEGSQGWATVRQVTIPARPYMRPTLVQDGPRAVDFIQKQIGRTLN